MVFAAARALMIASSVGDEAPTPDALPASPEGREISAPFVCDKVDPPRAASLRPSVRAVLEIGMKVREAADLEERLAALEENAAARQDQHR